MDEYSPDPRLQRVEANNLVLGMYVAELDRPWLESSYPVQGFYLQSDSGLKALAEECSHVFVDPRRYDTRLSEGFLKRKPSGKKEPKQKSNIVQLNSVRPKKPKIYSDSVEISEELVPAQTSLDEAVDVMKEVVNKLRKSGMIEIQEIESAIKPLVDSVMRNKLAIAALLRMRSLGSYSYAHALSCAVWTALLGRELGFSKDDIDRMALGCAMMDVGKLQIPGALLESTEPLTPDIWEIMKSHVDQGIKFARVAGVEEELVLQMMKTHHERHDGSGYPQGLRGNQIPVFGRIAGIVDSYDAMISDRPYAKAISSFEAIQQLQAHTDDWYQKELVDHFIKAIGVFPVGTIVQLNTGTVGVVVSQNEMWRLKPKVMLILDEEKNKRDKLTVIDLAASGTGEQSGLTVWITKELPTNAYGIDPGQYFL